MGQAGRGSTSKVPMAPNTHFKVRSEMGRAAWGVNRVVMLTYRMFINK